MLSRHRRAGKGRCQRGRSGWGICSSAGGGRQLADPLPHSARRQVLQGKLCDYQCELEYLSWQSFRDEEMADWRWTSGQVEP